MKKPEKPKTELEMLIAKLGAKGGRKRWKNAAMTKAQRSAEMARVAKAGWAKRRAAK